jgi:hypothetical protein
MEMLEKKQAQEIGLFTLGLTKKLVGLTKKSGFVIANR